MSSVPVGTRFAETLAETLAATVGHDRLEPLAQALYGGLSWGLVRAHARTGIGRLGGRPGNAILVFHAVGEDADDGFVGNVSTAHFRRVIRTVTERHEVVPLAAITDRTDEQAVAITFDDGLRSVYTNALPILREYDVPATVFVNPGFVDDSNRALIHDRHAIESDERISMTDDEVRHLADDPSISIGNHTLTHPNLAEIDDEEVLHAEIVEARDVLRDRYGVSADAFCYPYGNFNERARETVERSHELSVTTAPFLVDPSGGSHRLPRISGANTLAQLEWELSPASDLLHTLRRRYTALATTADPAG